MRGKQLKLSLDFVSVKKVEKILKKLKTSTSVGLDGLDSYSVKVSADIISKPLHHIITLALMQNKFPSSWKCSKVIPLHKKGSKLERQNYRPVSILSPLSKVLEKVMFDQMYRYFSGNNILVDNLHGYRSHRSTQTALTTMYDRWVRAAEKGNITGVLLLDLSAAFDLVDHELLLKKLKIYGAQKDLLDMIASYLGGRSQAVWIDHVLSDFLYCNVGVPQGSNLGPLLFLIYFNDLPDNISENVDSYADDTTISVAGQSVSEIEKKLTRECTHISRWMQANRLKVNPDKTHVMKIGTKPRLESQP